MKHVAVIGAGAAGLAAAKNLLATPDKFQVTVFEQSGQLGGTWVYTDMVGTDEYGLPVHSSMYKSLRTNLPKEVMGYPDFPVPENPKSYITAAEILRFLEQYATKFGVTQHIKFRHHVSSIRPRDEARWDIEVKDLKSGVTTLQQFDAIMVCNGHYNTPFIPNIDDADKFQGKFLHSHDYREPQPFKGKRVIVIGAGPSGMDLALEIASYAKQVILSHHNPQPIRTQFPSNVKMTCDVTAFSEHQAHFKDGTVEDIDVVFYCTGYCYNFPFLSAECGVKVQDNSVKPLYKHLIHIDNPTMCFVGLPFYVCAFSLFDLQSRFFLQILDGKFALPSRDAMLADAERERKWRIDQGLTPRQSHMMGPMQGDYYKELARTAGIKPLPPVLAKLHNESSQRFLDDLCHYRQDVYRIIDEYNFQQVL